METRTSAEEAARMGGQVPRLAARLKALASTWTAAWFVAAGLAHSAPPLQPLLQPLRSSDATPPAPWRVAALPQQREPATRFTLEEVGGVQALRVEANQSYGYLVHSLPKVSAGVHLSWRWRVDQMNTKVDLRQKQGDDTSIKVCAAFDLPLERVPFLERQLLRVARSRSSEDLPAATICYVWDAHLPVGTQLHNAFSPRLRYMVLQSGPASDAVSWRAQRRDLAADFLALFGRESPEVPRLIGVSVGADADNTQGLSVAHVVDLQLVP
jgi:hypothetical protein